MGTRTDGVRGRGREEREKRDKRDALVCLVYLVCLVVKIRIPKTARQRCGECGACHPGHSLKKALSYEFCVLSWRQARRAGKARRGLVYLVCGAQCKKNATGGKRATWDVGQVCFSRLSGWPDRETNQRNQRDQTDARECCVRRQRNLSGLLMGRHGMAETATAIIARRAGFRQKCLRQSIPSGCRSLRRSSANYGAVRLWHSVNA